MSKKAILSHKVIKLCAPIYRVPKKITLVRGRLTSFVGAIPNASKDGDEFNCSIVSSLSPSYFEFLKYTR